MNKLFKIESTILIVILTASSYGIAYAYQRSYRSYYKLPNMFIELDINSLTSTLFTVFITFAVVYSIWNYIKILYSLYSEYIPSRFINKFTSLSFFKDVLSELTKYPKLWYVFKLLFFISAMQASTVFFGEYEASKQKDYMVIKQEENLFVAVTSYKDSLIIAPLNLEKESMIPKFKAIEMKELKDAEMVYFANGLKVEDVKNSKDLIE